MDSEDGRAPIGKGAGTGLAARTPTLPIFWRLLLGFVLPSAILFALFGAWAYFQTTDAADQEMGLRLAAVARAASVVVLPEELSFLEPGDEGSRTYRGLARRIETLRRNTGVERVYFFTPSLRSLVDTRPGVKIGSRYYHLQVQKTLLDEVARTGAKTTLLYRGHDGRFYKTGFSVVRDATGKIVAYSAVEAGASYFAGVWSVAEKMALAGLAALVLLVMVTALLARHIASPLRRLALAAARMGEGNLSEPVDTAGAGEVGMVAFAMEQMRRELGAREQELRLMLAGVAHEVRNPLAGMELSAGLLREDLSDDPERAAQVDEILADLEYLKRVVQDFLEYARWDKVDSQSCDPWDLVEDSLSLVAAEADARGIELKLDRSADQEGERLTCDVDPIRRTLVNLLKNSIQACKKGGTVLVSVEHARGRDGDRMVISVEDTGPGVAPEDRERIFEPFFTTKEKGSGLGLALAMKVAKAHGGSLSCEEPKVLTGTRFVLALPVGDFASIDSKEQG